MKIEWKRVINNKKIKFEADFVLNGKINYDNVRLSKNDIEKEYLVESVQSVLEEYFLNKLKKREEAIKNNDNLVDEKFKVRNHFRNICFRKKFQTIKEHVDYVAKYYGINQMQVLDYIEEDLPIIKKQVGIN